MKKKMKTFARKGISALKSLFSAKKKHFEIIFVLDGASFIKLKIIHWKSFVKSSLPQNLENSAFCLIFHLIFS